MANSFATCATVVPAARRFKPNAYRPFALRRKIGQYDRRFAGKKAGPKFSLGESSPIPVTECDAAQRFHWMQYGACGGLGHRLEAHQPPHDRKRSAARCLAFHQQRLLSIAFGDKSLPTGIAEPVARDVPRFGPAHRPVFADRTRHIRHRRPVDRCATLRTPNGRGLRRHHMHFAVRERSPED